MKDPADVAALNRQAAVLENVFFPAHMLASLGIADSAAATAARLFLANFRDGAGGAADTVEKVLLDQIASTHLKISEMHALAAVTADLQFKQAYSNAAARLVGCICQLVSTLAAYRSAGPTRRRQAEKQPAGKPKKQRNGSGSPPESAHRTGK